MEEIIQILKSLEFNWQIEEIFAVFFSVLYVILAAKENIWCWLSAAISVSLYIYICYNAQMYPETGLQVFYLLMAIYGYLMWTKKDTEKIKEWSEIKHLIIIFIGGILTFFMGFYFTEYTDSKNPIIDSFTTVFSVMATYMIIRKILGSWLYWIIIDAVAIYLYYSRDLHLSSLLFFAYSILAIYGYFSWNKKINSSD